MNKARMLGRVLVVCGLLNVGLAEVPAQEDEKPAAEKPAADAPMTTKDKASYAIGRNIGNNFVQQEIELDAKWVARGIADAIAKKDAPLSDEDLEAAVNEFRRELFAKREMQLQAVASKNANDGKAFLEANAKKEGVEVLPSGLQYKVIEAGDGPMPEPTDQVSTHYEGTLIDGTVFDSSYQRGEPATFPVNQVIKGWQEALPKMKVGSKWQIFVPSDLAYGERGAGENIGPNETLIFTIELLGIQ